MRLARIVAVILVLAVALAAVGWVLAGGSGRVSAKPLRSAALRMPTAAPGLVAPEVTSSGTAFTQDGRRVLLRGFNVPISSPAVYRQAWQLHANFVRIPVAWSAVEPHRPTGSVNHLEHHWDTALLRRLDAQVAALGKHHVQVLIDFHQYHWSPFFGHVACSPSTPKCIATGVPAWYYAGRYPATKQGLSQAQADFWVGQKNASLFYYSAFAQMMARRYGHAANVVGYELFNEPHQGWLSSGVATHAMLAWQSKLYRVVHAVDPRRLVFVMCRGGGNGVGTADLSVFGPHPRIALDFHDYFNGRPGTGFDASGDDWKPSWAATHTQKLAPAPGYQGTAAAQAAVLEVPLAASRRAGIPLLVGEWGIHSNDLNAHGYTQQMLAVFDHEGISWARWRLWPGFGYDLLKALPPYAPRPQALQISLALAH